MANIENGLVHDLKHEEFFNVMLHNGDNPAVKLECDFEGMPIKTLVKLAYDTMKVKFRPHVKGMQTEKFKEAFNNKTISWREMINKDAAKSVIEMSEKTPEELDAEIKRLMALRAVNTDEGNNDND